MTDRLNLPSESDIKNILKLDRKNLPSFPQVAAKLIEASRDESIALEDVSKIIETDPGISARILEIVNSAYYGLSRKITTLSEAVVILGLDEIKKVALGMTIFENMFKKGKSDEFNRLLFWRHSLAVAVLSMELAKATKNADPEEAYIAGLLHDVGKIFLDLQGRTDYGNFIQQLSASTDLVIEKERSVIGLGHDDIGAYFCAQWQLPEKLVLAVKYHHQPFEHQKLSDDEKHLIAIVSMADFLCWTQGIGSFDFIRPPILAPEVEVAVDPEKVDVIQCILAMNKEVENISEFYKFVFPSVNELKENLLWANIKLSKANTKYYFQADPQSSLQSLPQENHPGSAESMVQDLGLEMGKALARAKNIKEVLDIVMFQVGCIFQPCHWSILLKDSKSDDLVFSVVVGANKDKLQGVKLNRGEGIAGHIMETGEALIIEDVSRDSRFSDRVDKHTRFKTQSIIGTPLKTEGKIFGVIELINRIDNNNFSDQDLRLLSDIAEYAAIAIERSYYTQALTNLATKDAVTGLKNRWSFERAVSGKRDFKAKFGNVFSMLIIVINGLDRIKAEQGEETCEKGIMLLAGILKQTKRRDDTLYRYGDDSFIAMLPMTYSDGAEHAKQRIEKALNLGFAEEKLHPLPMIIQPHTLDSEDAVNLKALVAEALAKSKSTPGQAEEIMDLQENLQPLLEEEQTKAKEEEDRMKSQTPGSTGNFGKMVSLGGSFKRLKTGEFGRIRVEQVSLSAIGFRISKSHRIRVNDFLDIQFNLDDIKRSLIKRRIVVREIKGNYIYADFYNPPPYAKNLGFYIFS
ncbi:MAG: HDOD domain-containing protein [Desulfobacter sp.]|nr:MAG: HDOD domain-containing protein [Desulfobacter sp.]